MDAEVEAVEPVPERKPFLRYRTEKGGTAPVVNEDDEYNWPDIHGEYNNEKLRVWLGTPGWWTQDAKTLTLVAPIDSKARVKESELNVVELTKSECKVLHGKNVVVEGGFWHNIRPEKTSWQLGEWSQDDDDEWNRSPNETFFFQQATFTFVKEKPGRMWDALFWEDLGLP